MAVNASKMKQWVLRGKGSLDCLQLEEASIPEVGERQVLVKLHVAALNYRDVMITMVRCQMQNLMGQLPLTYAQGTSMWPQSETVVPMSDGAGEVVRIGSRVTRFSIGQRVMPTFVQGFVGGTLTLADNARLLGGSMDGVLREFGAFDDDSLVEIPRHLSFQEAATLLCAGLTAWNALYGAQPLRAGDTILTLGTGGVSVFALQFAAAAGAQVISTTSSDAKGEKLKQLGAHHVINYKSDHTWGETAKKLSLYGQGVQHVLEIGGLNTLAQSAKAAAIDAQVAIIETRAGKDEMDPWSPHSHLLRTRRIVVGNRLQFEDMNRALEINKIHPVIDETQFELNDAKQALVHLMQQQHFGKVVIKIS